ncbi:MAG: MtrB/PioB family outer membrane beta-barrel protein [Acidobacteria bacterium]|nr:MtrB/PioB family outer membrane beta-barrel protein [Acidobacteriota bacterium]
MTRLRSNSPTAVITLALLALFAAAGRAQQADTGKKKEQPPTQVPAPPAMMPAHYSGGFASIGAILNELSGSPDKYSEYQSLRQGIRPTVQAGAWGTAGRVAYDLLGERGVDPNDQNYSILADFARYWKSEFSFKRLPHRLENDQLSNLDAAKGSVVVRHDNGDTGLNYCPYYQELEFNNRITLPFMPLISFKVDYREQLRHGTTQARAISKCANCHISSMARDVDQDTQEFRAGAAIRTRRASLEYEYLNRDFEDMGKQLTWTYDLAIHPATLQNIFINRVQYDVASGPLPIAAVPHFRKSRHTVRGRLDMERAGELTGAFIYSSNDNEGLNYGTDTRVVNGVYSVELGDRLRLTFQGRNVNITSGSVYVDVNEPVAPTGPQAGKTYTEANPAFGPADYYATSSLAREVFNGIFDGRLALAARTTLRFGYDYQNLRRTAAEPEETDTHRLRAAINSSPAKGWKARARYSYTHVKDPFTHYKAAFTPQIQPYPSPGTPPSPLLGTQYFTLYRARRANLTNFFTREQKASGSVTWEPVERFALTAHLAGYSQKNTDLNFAPWEDSDFSPSIEFWAAPSPRFDLSANYTMHRRETETLFVIPVFDG